MPVLYSSTGNSVAVGTGGSYGTPTSINVTTGKRYFDNTTKVSVTASGIAAGETVTVRATFNYRVGSREDTISFTADGTQVIKMPIARDDCTGIILEATSSATATTATVSADVTGRVER